MYYGKQKRKKESEVNINLCIVKAKAILLQYYTEVLAKAKTMESPAGPFIIFDLCLPWQPFFFKPKTSA